MQRTTLLSGIAAMTLLFAGCNASANGQTKARTATQSFYADWSTDSSVKPVSTRYDTNAPVTTRFRNRLSALMNDSERVSSVFCGNGQPTSFDVSSDVQMTSEDTATVTVTQHFATGDVPVQVNLVRNGSANSNAWFIDDVECPNDNNDDSDENNENDDNDDDNDDSNDDNDDDNDDDDNSSSSTRSSNSSITSTSSSRSSTSSSSSVASSTSSSSSEREKAGKGQFCGGIAGIQCANGLTCQYEGTYLDAGGTCI